MARESGQERVKPQKTPEEISQENEEYNQAIKNVEDYTTALNSSASQENKLAYAIDEYNTNLEMLPELRPVATDVKPASVNTNVQDTAKPAVQSAKETKASIKKANASAKEAAKEAKNLAKQKAREEKQNKKFNTKGLIFNHKRTDAEGNEYIESSVSSQNTASQSSQTRAAQKVEKFNGVDLLPLDEIKVPDLHKNGYSIFSEGAY